MVHWYQPNDAAKHWVNNIYTIWCMVSIFMFYMGTSIYSMMVIYELMRLTVVHQIMGISQWRLQQWLLTNTNKYLAAATWCWCCDVPFLGAVFTQGHEAGNIGWRCWVQALAAARTALWINCKPFCKTGFHNDKRSLLDSFMQTETQDKRS